MKRRTELLVENGLIESEMDLYLGIGGDVWFAMNVKLDHPSAKEESLIKLAKYDGDLFTVGWDCSNVPTLITFDGMFESLTTVHEVVSTLTRLEGVLETNHVIVNMSYLFDTWVHRMSRGKVPLPRTIKVMAGSNAHNR